MSLPSNDPMPMLLRLPLRRLLLPRSFEGWYKNLVVEVEIDDRWYTTTEDTVSIGDFLTRYQNNVVYAMNDIILSSGVTSSINYNQW